MLVALSLVRELGPVVTALLFAGRAGTSLTAEIGLMKAGEQLAAMEMMAVDPLQRVLAPRFWGGFIAMPNPLTDGQVTYDDGTNATVDQMAKDVAAFEAEMKAAGVDYKLVKYPGAVHSFTHKEAGTDNAKGAAYNADADRDSWFQMEQFLKKAFGR